MKKYICMFIIALSMIMLTGCFQQKHKKYKDYLKFVDNMNCATNQNENISCNLKGKYEVISDESETFDRVKFKIKNTDLTFEVEYSFYCNRIIDGSGCIKKYDFTTNYHYVATDYYIKEFNKKNNINYCYISTDNKCHYNYLKPITNKKDLINRINYLNKLLDYINSLDHKVIGEKQYINLFFDKSTTKYNDEKELSIYIDFKNNKYEYRIYEDKNSSYSKYNPIDGKLETFINNFIKDKGIVLK